MRFSTSTLPETLTRAADHARMIALSFGALMAMSVAALLIWFVLSDRLLLLYATLFALQAVYVAYLSGQGFEWPVLSLALAGDRLQLERRRRVQRRGGVPVRARDCGAAALLAARVQAVRLVRDGIRRAGVRQLHATSSASAASSWRSAISCSWSRRSRRWSSRSSPGVATTAPPAGSWSRGACSKQLTIATALHLLFSRECRRVGAAAVLRAAGVDGRCRGADRIGRRRSSARSAPRADRCRTSRAIRRAHRRAQSPLVARASRQRLLARARARLADRAAVHRSRSLQADQRYATDIRRAMPA